MGRGATSPRQKHANLVKTKSLTSISTSTFTTRQESTIRQDSKARNGRRYAGHHEPHDPPPLLKILHDACGPQTAANEGVAFRITYSRYEHAHGVPLIIAVSLPQLLLTFLTQIERICPMRRQTEKGIEGSFTSRVPRNNPPWTTRGGQLRSSQSCQTAVSCEDGQPRFKQKKNKTRKSLRVARVR